MKAELKLKTLMPDEIARAAGGELITFGTGGKEVTNITYDSRDAKEGSLFCAIKGERADGHDFIGNVVGAGASVVIADHVPDGAGSFGDYSLVRVDDTVAALGRLAGYYRTFSRAKIVGVTGSVGKTTTKEFIASVLGKSFKTMRSQGNHNNEIGLPMTLFTLTPECEVAVLEMGMSARGEISFMTRLAKPYAAVITNIGTSHMASLGSRENICLAKLEIAEGMDSDGFLVMNGDEPLLTEHREGIAPKKIYCGMFSKTADVKAVNVRGLDGKMSFDVIYSGHVAVNVEVPALGRHNVYNALSAWTIGTIFGMDEGQIREGLLSFKGAEMRQKIYDIGKITVIEDCYNAAPESMRAAIEVLKTEAEHRGAVPCALLGDMLELGESSRLMHDRLGQLAAREKIEKLYCYGEMADTIAEAAINGGIRAENVHVCSDSGDPARMAAMIASSISPGDILLVKASRGIAAEKVIGKLKQMI